MPETWKRTETGKPYLSWCLIVRNAEKTLEACLRSIRERTPEAEIVVIDTCSSDSTPEIAQRYADVFEVYRGPRGDWNEEMPWFDDAAAARQYAFERASGVWRGWIDADDRLPGPEEAETILKANGRWKPPPRKKEKLLEGPSNGAPTSLVDILRYLDEQFRDTDTICIWAPYLYQRDADGHAVVWHSRERIVKWGEPPKWHWAEAAHEILVPKAGVAPAKVELPHLVYVHEKDFSPEAIAENITRHREILLRQYERGEVTTRRCLYLAELCKDTHPDRVWEFLEAGHKAATTLHDRYRCLVQKALYFADRGLLRDAAECFGAATAVCPELPDAWLAAGERFALAEDHARAVAWLRTGLSKEYDSVASYVPARHMAVRYPTLLALELQALAKDHVHRGEIKTTIALLGEACETLHRVVESDAVAADRDEARAYLVRAWNDKRAHEEALAIERLVRYLVDNDEPLKALRVLDAAPWNLQDHPTIVGLQAELEKVRRHVADEGAYFAFYLDDEATGHKPSPEEWLEPDKCITRAKWMADWINEHKPDARVLDFGCFDGIVGIPLLRRCPGIRYVGVDPHPGAIERFRDRLERFGLADRAHIQASTSPHGIYDVIIWSEVIEHVPDPLAYLQELRSMLGPEGVIFVTTPWGSFDKGVPPERHDPRGHLRVVTAREMTEYADKTALAVEELWKEDARLGATGDAMNVILRKSIPYYDAPIRFVVPSALWDWHGRSLEARGMGASEETIAYLAAELAKTDLVEVFGPVPDPDVHRGVRYWPREQLRYAKGRQKLVVSRSPSFGKYLPEAKPKILWLQDAWYGDLNAETAAFYDKVVVVSEWHKKATHELHGVPLEKLVVARNFLRREHFPVTEAMERKNDRFIYASSPDRGLVQLLRLWPRIRARLPDAELWVYYGWKGCEKLGLGGDAAWAQRYESARREVEELRHQPGITFFGMVNHEELARAMRSAGVWAYPCLNPDDTPFYETGCLTACKVRAAGMIPVCPDWGALAETAASSWTEFVDPRHADDFVEACERATIYGEMVRLDLMEEAVEDFALEAILPVWRSILR